MEYTFPKHVLLYKIKNIKAINLNKLCSKFEFDILQKLAFSNILFGCNIPNVSTRWNMLPIHFQCCFSPRTIQVLLFFPQDHLTFSNYVHDFVCVHISKYVHVHTHTHTYTHVCTHTHTHTHTQRYKCENICLIKKDEKILYNLQWSISHSPLMLKGASFVYWQV